MNYIPNGVTSPAILPAGEQLERWDLSPGQYVFTACRFVPEKGLDDLLEAYQHLADPPFKLVIAGDTDHESEYSRNLKKKAARIKGVVLTGFVSGNALGELFSNAGLFVLPSYYEGLPIALLEALGYGLPVLVSNIPQHLEVGLEPFRYFPLGDTAFLAQALQSNFQIGIPSSEKEKYFLKLKNEYNWDKIAAQTLEVYNNL